MAFQFSTDVRNAVADAVETTIGASPTLEIRSGAAPADCAAADSGTVLASMTLPADWLTNAASGSKSLSGSWTDASADANGTAGHFRIKAAGVCKWQGTVTATGGGGDMTLDNATVTAGVPVTITTGTLTTGNA